MITVKEFWRKSSGKSEYINSLICLLISKIIFYTPSSKKNQLGRTLGAFFYGLYEITGILKNEWNNFYCSSLLKKLINSNFGKKSQEENSFEKEYKFLKLNNVCWSLSWLITMVIYARQSEINFLSICLPFLGSFLMKWFSNIKHFLNENLFFKIKEIW